IEQGTDIVGYELEVFIVVGNRARLVAFAMVDIATRTIDRRARLRAQLQHLVIVGDRLIMAAKMEGRTRTHEVGGGASRVKLDRAIGIGYRALAIVDDGPEIGAVCESLREARIDFNRVIQILLGFIQPALLRECQAALSKGYRFG